VVLLKTETLWSPVEFHPLSDQTIVFSLKESVATLGFVSRA